MKHSAGSDTTCALRRVKGECFLRLWIVLGVEDEVFMCAEADEVLDGEMVDEVAFEGEVWVGVVWYVYSSGIFW